MAFDCKQGLNKQKNKYMSWIIHNYMSQRGMFDNDNEPENNWLNVILVIIVVILFGIVLKQC